MALIKCSECGKEFSNKASACPNCAFPVEKKQKNVKAFKELTKEEKKSVKVYMRNHGELSSTSDTILLIIGAISLLIGLFVHWLFLFVVWFCVLRVLATRYDRTIKYYYDHPECIKNK